MFKSIMSLAFVFCLLPITAQAQSEREFTFDFDRDTGPTVCALPDFKISPETKIYGSGAYGGQELAWQIDDSGHEATLFKIAVNSPEEPVILVLSAYEPSIWHIGWTRGTQITAVLLSGYHTQKITGLPKGVPILNSTYENGGACGSVSEISQMGTLVKQVFGREIDKNFPPVKGQAALGKTLADEKLISMAELRKEDFVEPNTPLAGEQGLTEAVRNGLIKKATASDIQAYLAAEAREAGLPERIIAAGIKKGDGFFHNAYVVLSSDFIIPAGLYGANSATFILPEGIVQPRGPVAHCRFLSYADSKSPPVFARSIADTCSFGDFKVPPDLKIYAAGAYSGGMDITVNSPEEPVALFLGAYEPTGWHLNWTPGSKIAAVVVSGYYSQRISGLPKGVPVLNASREVAGPCPYFYVSPNLENLRTINDLSKHLFKKNLEAVYHVKNGKAVIGYPLPDNAKLETAE